MRKIILIVFSCVLLMYSHCYAQNAELSSFNRFLRTFDNGYYGPLEVRGGYLYCNIEGGRQSKMPVKDISKAVSMTDGAKIVCKSGDCVTGVNGSMYTQMSFRTSSSSLNKQKLVNDLNRLIRSIKRQENNSYLSANNNVGGFALQRINTFLSTFDNGYYGPLEVRNGYLYCNIEGGRQSKIPVNKISRIGTMTDGAKILCKSGDCVTGVNGSMYPHMSFRSSGSYNKQKLISLLEDLLFELKNGRPIANNNTQQTTNINQNNTQFNSTNNQITHVETVTNEKRVALIFGNSNYSGSASLGANPINDAKDIASTLRELGFDVILRTDANLTSMNNAIRDFGRRSRDADVAFFYFAGHGMQIDRVNYILPTQLNIKDKNDVDFECISVAKVQKIMEANNPNRLNLIVLDACRNNPFRSWERGGESGLADMTPPSGTLIAFATSPGSTASNGIGRNGLYTGELIKQLRVPQRIEDVFINVRIAVEDKSGGRQSPWELARLRGKYSLIK